MTARCVNTVLMKRLSVLLILLLILGISSITKASGGTQVDVVLAVNGSGSISPADFQLQLNGIRTALQNDEIFPRNGTIGFALVQYADGITRTHIPLTPVNTSTIRNLVNRVSSIQQITGLTNPGDGINDAVGILFSSTANDQVICLSTDGIENSGADTEQAAMGALLSNVDVLSVLAIQDPGQFNRLDAERFYGPLVFRNGPLGSGDLVFVDDAVEFAISVGAVCLAQEMDVVGFEVNQAIQDWNNSVPLVANRNTLVRVHVQPKDPNATFVTTARLKAYTVRNGNPGTLIGEVSPINQRRGNVPPGHIQVRANAAERRGRIDDSLNFWLPPDWVSGQDIILEIEGAGFDCVNASDDIFSRGNCQTRTLSFSPNSNVTLFLYRLEINGTPSVDPWVVSDQLAQWQSLMPVTTAPMDVRFRELSLNISPQDVVKSDGTILKDRIPLVYVNSALHILSEFPECDTCWQYGFVPDKPELFYPIGLAMDIPSSVASGLITDPNKRNINVFAHELGHSFNQQHATLIGSVPNTEGYVEGQCGELAEPDTSVFDASYIFGDVLTFSPLSPNGRRANYVDDDLLFGVKDVIYSSSPPQIVDPYEENAELMSYCKSQTQAMPSGVTYEGILRYLTDIYIDPVPPIPIAIANASTPYPVISGIINLDDSSGEIQPIFPIFTDVVPPDMPSGTEYAIELYNGGALVESIGFEPFVSESLDYPGVTGPDYGIFSVPVADLTGIDEIRLTYNGTPLDTRLRSANAPTVVVINPSADITENTVTFSWNSSDSDGDDLVHNLLASYDGGSTFEAIALGETGTSIEISKSALRTTSNLIIRVVASDGFNFGFDDSDAPVSVSNNLPLVQILSPTAGEYFADQPVILSARAIDSDDGIVSDIRWTSNLDGNLGTGDLYLEAKELSEGIHTITATAFDSDGGSDSMSVEITITRLFIPGGSLPPETPVEDGDSSDDTGGITVLEDGTLLVDGVEVVQLPQTGETPVWRSALVTAFAGVGFVILGFVVYNIRLRRSRR